MQTTLADFIRDTPAGSEAAEILGKCVHCGFCTATCPTYQLLGDELDGPRGRIYLIKQVLEGAEPTAKTQLHLDRCLTCRACETTCPSGVKYARLLDIGRAVVDAKVTRPPLDAMARGALRAGLPRPHLFAAALGAGRAVRGLLPSALQAKIPPHQSTGPQPSPRHARRMIALAGCAQPAMYPNINAASQRVLDHLGISLIEPPRQGCCGAVRQHLSAPELARADMRRNIDAWWPWIEAGAEAVVITASGCGAHVREYGHLLHDDPAYAYKAERVAELARDVSEVVAAESERLTALLSQHGPGTLASPLRGMRVAVHNPCSLQHGMQLRGLIEGILTLAGATLTPVADGHLCCGSAGTYSLLQPEIAGRLKANKQTALLAGDPALIVSANIGCIAHLGDGVKLPLRHWIEVIDELL